MRHYQLFLQSDKLLLKREYTPHVTLKTGYMYINLSIRAEFGIQLNLSRMFVSEADLIENVKEIFSHDMAEIVPIKLTLPHVRKR